MEYSKLLEKIIKKNEASIKQTLKYEKVKCWSFAYLSRWTVLEFSIKELFNIYNKKIIRIQANEWIKYLDNEIPTVPKPIKNFIIETRIIPPNIINILQELFGSCEKVEKAINPGNKYRKKRNKIAHFADEIKNESTYIEYRNTVNFAIEQLISKLN